MAVTELSPREKFLNNPSTVLIGGQGVYVSRSREIHAALKEFGSRVGGAVSLTGISNIVASQLRLGQYNLIGAAIDAFPFPELAKRVEKKFGVGGEYKFPPKPGKFVTGTKEQVHDLNELYVFASFAEVFMAKNGQNGNDPTDGFVGGNLLDKINFNLPLVLGALVGGIDYFVIGAGIPTWLPGAVDDFITGRESTYWMYMKGYDKDGKKDKYPIRLDPMAYLPEKVFNQLRKPAVLAIFSSTSLVKRYREFFDGFVLEGRLAGGHLGPEGKKGIVPEEALAARKPFYLAGNWSHRLSGALEIGATGIQIGSVTAITQESGYPEADKLRIIAGVHDRTLDVVTSANASPTGYEFNIVKFGQDDTTLSNPVILAKRIRNCSEGFLVTFQVDSKGKIIEYCRAEPVSNYAIKLGLITPDMSQEAKERTLAQVEKDLSPTVCLCNALESAAGYPTNGIMRNRLGNVVKEPEPRLLTWGRGAIVDPDAREQILRLTPDPARLPSIIEVIADVLSY